MKFYNKLTHSLFVGSLLVGSAFITNNVIGQNLEDDTQESLQVSQEEIEYEPPQVEIKKSQESTVEASLTDLTNSAYDIGINRMIFVGEQSLTPNPDGTQNVDILWTEAYYIDDEGEKKETAIFSELTTNVTVQPDLDKGDQASLGGEAPHIEILAAWARLQSEEEEEIEEEIVSEEEQLETANAVSNGGGAGASETDAREAEFEGLNFVAPEEINFVSTTDGCDIVVDIAQNAAIVYERVIDSATGVEESPCSETTTRYPLDKSYGSCPLSFNTDDMRAYEQYTTFYLNPEDSGQIQVQDCTADTDSFIALVEDTNGCVIRDDFATNVSIQQAQITYTHNGADQTFQGCTDTDTTYPHVEVTDTSVCPPVVNQVGGTVALQSRIMITVDGVDQYITSCAPTGDTIAITEEECTGGSRYTHDFASNQSYINKTYYYMDGADRVDVVTCQASTDTLPHMDDESVCTPTHDDVLKETTLEARTYVEEVSNTPIYIDTCDAVTPKISYVKTADRWRIISSGSQNITPNTSDGNNINIVLRSFGQNPMQSGYVAGQLSNWSNPTTGNVRSAVDVTDFLGDRNGDSSQFTSVTISGSKYCLDNALTAPWQSGAVTIDSANSTTTPTFSRSFSASHGYVSTAVTLGYRTYDYCSHASCVASNVTWTASCSNLQCQVTQLQANPVYLRGDNSEYLDITTTTDTKYVCGTGSNIDGDEF
jgi:hypothetical protein